ncbi:MAG: septum formation initiator family protein, partial [Deltaproteobacteria bacterium]|nr:septum formation initiator family protein [Deltaproteobacteria bacterium]
RAGRKYLEGSHKKNYVFFAAILTITAVAVFGDKGLLDVWRLRKERDGIISFNRPLEKSNRALDSEIALLKTDRKYIEYIAKKELGMIGRNEAVYKIEGPVRKE